MNENLIVWLFLFAMIFYWLVWKHCLQGKMEKCKLRWTIDPVVVSSVCLFLFHVRSAYDIVKYDMIGYQWLTSPIIEQNLEAAPFSTDQLLEDYKIPKYLRYAALVGPVAGTLAFVLVILQAMQVMKYAHIRSRKTKGHRSIEDTCILMVIMMPAFFIAMNSRALIRILAVMTGSCWGRNYTGTYEDWNHLRVLELGLYQMDLELGAAFQYVTVFAFAILCGKALDGAPTVSAEWKRTMKLAGIQGIYAYVVIGVLRSVGNFSLQLAESFWKKEVTEQQVDEFQSNVLAKLSSMFLLTTLLCIYNMMILSKMPELQQKIPNATVKFLATRMLLLVAQVQPGVFNSLRSSQPLIIKAKALPMFQNNDIVQNWHLSEEQSKLWHASFLGIECLVVVLINLVCWGCNSRIDDDDEVPSNQLPLLETGPPPTGATSATTGATRLQ